MSVVAARIDGDVRQVVGGLRVVGSTATTTFRSTAREAKMASTMMNTFGMSTVRATAAAKALNMVMLAGAFGTMTLGIAGAALALLSFAGNANQSQGVMEANADQIGILNERLSDLKEELGLTEDETDANTEAFDDLATGGTENAMEFADSVEDLIMNSTNLTAEQKAALLEIIQGIRAGAGDINAIYAQAEAEHRPITDAEREQIRSLWEAIDENMGNIQDKINDTYSGADGVFGTFDDAIDYMSPEGEMVQALLGLAGQHDELDASLDRVTRRLIDELIPALEVYKAEINIVEDAIRRLQDGLQKGYEFIPTSGEQRMVRPPSLGTGPGMDWTPQWWDDLVGGVGNIFGDVIWRPGEAPIAVDPGDTITASKGGGGAGGGENITINVTGNTLRSDADIDELVRRISAELRDRTGRRI